MDRRTGSDVLIVVPCLNEEAHLPGLLADLLRDAGDALVVVADGGSVDRSREIVRGFADRHTNLRLLDNPKRIQSAAVNLAACNYGAGRRWLVRIDAHAGYPERFVERLVSAAEDRRATSVVVPMHTQGSSCFQRSAAAAQNSLLGTGGAVHRHPGRGQWVEHGHHALFDLTLFMAVGGYDEDFAANEDSELDRRLLAGGGRIWIEPQAAITYHPRATPSALFRQYRNYGKGRARNLKRHPAPVKLRQMLPIGVAPAIVAGTVGLIAAPWRAEALFLALPVLAWVTGSLLVGALLGLRSRSACDACAGVAAMTMHAGWSLGFVAEVLNGCRLPSSPLPLKFSDPPVREHSEQMPLIAAVNG
ncbi:succinoglycan biosynthesis protein exoa [Novosphingobium guangzhouense]|uniref:Succinoglycan biosynthesis protein exoa n=2 Tax=Novosphingobium guangzhouense TaxID=1850347 RepID=A0A2K2FWP7_9SPHN|nr:succinoglycan biosynthesis protein exoa [Novosphingobium guangzhouense]